MIRAFTSALLWLVAVAAIAVTLPVAWVAVNVADEDGYVAFTAPFAQDAELQDALSDGVADSVAEITDVALGQRLLRQLVDGAFTRLVDEPDFPAAWVETQRASHRATFGNGDQQRIVVDIGPLVELVGDAISDDLPVTLQVPDEVVVPVTQAVQPETISAVQQAPSRALLGGTIAVVATLGSLLFARRRSTTFGFWGLGVAAVGGILMVATSRAVPGMLESRPADDPLATTMRDLLIARATASFDEWLLVTVVVGAVATLLGFGARLVRR